MTQVTNSIPAVGQQGFGGPDQDAPQIGTVIHAYVELRSPAAATDDSCRSQIVDDEGILGHYIADASEPLHITVSHNGWELSENPENYTRDKTLHVRFEADFIHSHVHHEGVAPLMRKVQNISSGLPYIY
jgi:hypothetical protein